MIAAYPRWYHRIEVRPGVITPGINDSPLQLQMMQLPADCSGMRVLDIGTRDGFFSFELERRGADLRESMKAFTEKRPPKFNR